MPCNAVPACGSWDALIDRRADLVVGAPGEPPPGYGIASRSLFSVEFVFAVVPHHPLAARPQPLEMAEISRYRAVVAADSSRRLPARSGGILPGQELLIVPTLAAKVAAQLAGLGVGFLPRAQVAPHQAAGRLVICEVEQPRPAAQLQLAWRSGEDGRALKWFRERLPADLGAFQN
jgi:DNA-binding transcriptional LysR family regulator